MKTFCLSEESCEADDLFHLSSGRRREIEWETPATSTRHRPRRPDQAITDGAPLGLVGRHHDDDDVQVERVAFMKDRIEPLTGGFGLSELHKVKSGGKIGKGCGSEDKQRGVSSARRSSPGPRPSRRGGPAYEEHNARRAFPGSPAVHRQAWPRPPGCLQPGRALPGIWAISSGPIGPGRRMRKGERVRSRTVDSRPRVVGPLSRIRSIRPSRSARTCSARVGESRFERLALGAASGWPSRSIKPRATGGRRDSQRDRLPAAGDDVGNQARPRGRTSVSGPGQNRPARRSGGFGPVGGALLAPGRFLPRGRSGD